MPKPIKTREFKRDIKLRNPVRPAARQVKYAAIKTKTAAAKQIESPQVSPNDYAGEVIEEKAKSVALSTAQTLDTQGRRAVRKTYQLRREKAKGEPAADASADTAAELKKKKKPKKKQQPSKSKQPVTSINQEQKPAPSKQKPSRKISQTQKNIKTVTQRTKQGQQAAKSAAKTARNAMQTAQRIQQTAKQAVQNTKRAVKATYKAIKATYEGTKALIYAVIAGGWVSVIIIILVCLVGFLFASPFGIFFTGGGSDKTITQIVAELEDEYEAQLEQLQFNYVHDELVLEGAEGIDWPEVLAVYAVKNHSEVDGALTLDEKNIGKLREILGEMYCYTYSVKTEQGEAGLLRVLTIKLLQKSADEMADVYHFNEAQRAQLAELLDPEQAALWESLLEA